ncbi:MAG: transglutaminase domain-containing protein [Candidatus Thorarchaeota archaeon]
MAEVARRSGTRIGTLIGSFVVLAIIIWSTYSFVLVQFGQPRSQIPHEEYQSIGPWPYDIPWAGGRSSWFEGTNYTHLPLDWTPPANLLQNLDNVIFYVAPEDPPQLWRTTAYDSYDGSTWAKSRPESERDLSHTELVTREEAQQLGNPIYIVLLNITAGPYVGTVELPSLFPEILVIEDSFRTGRIVNGQYQVDAESRLIDYELVTDDYGTLLFRPLLQARTGENVLVSYEVTYRRQDLEYIASAAMDGIDAPPSITSMYGRPTLNDVVLTQNVRNTISQFENIGNAYETAIAVSLYFRSNFELMIMPPDLYERPPAGQELTDWFLARGGGLPMDFATAYCVFMRYLEIPARITMGYAVGDPEGGYRSVRVRHMIFWVEVYIPLNNPYLDGEWIQVLPLPIQLDEPPENVDLGTAELSVFHNRPQGWVQIGHSMNFYARLTVGGNPTGTSLAIRFFDVTDQVVLGQAYTNSSGVATVTYVFPAGSSVGLHQISAMCQIGGVQVSNSTQIYVVAVPEPLRIPTSSSGFMVSDTVSVDLKQGLDNYTAYWFDTLRLHGVFTVNGQPYQPTYNRYIQIIWDGIEIASVMIGSDGRYEYLLQVIPTDPRVRLGIHTVYSNYTGDYTPEGVPLLLPARSDDSTVEIWGRSDLRMTVNATLVFRGDTVRFEGNLTLLNGTSLAGQTVGIVLGEVLIGTPQTELDGSFTFEYPIPDNMTYGVYYVYAVWTSTLPLITNSTTTPIGIRLESMGARISIFSSAPSNIAHPTERFNLYGNLVDRRNSSGLVGKSVNVYIYSGPVLMNSGTIVTGQGGYYNFSYAVPADFVGTLLCWSEYISTDPLYEGARSENISITVVSWPTRLPLTSDRNSYFLDEIVTISGGLFLVHNGTALPPTNLTLQWSDRMGTQTFRVRTSNDGSFVFHYNLSLADSPGNVLVVVSFVSNSLLYQDVSNQTRLELRLYRLSITIDTDLTLYHLNETVRIAGQLRFEHNSTPIEGQSVVIYWRWSNGTIQALYPGPTGPTGSFVYFYNCSPDKDSQSVVQLWAVFLGNTVNPLWDNATSTERVIELALYELVLSMTVPTNVNIDQSITIEGFLTHASTSAPMQNVLIRIYLLSGTSWILIGNDTTDQLGYYRFVYMLSWPTQAPGIYRFKCNYTSTDPMVSSVESPQREVNVSYLIVSWGTITYESPVYRGQTVIIRGTVTLSNGTELGGYQVVLLWRNTIRAMNVTDEYGRFVLVYQIQWSEPVGELTFRVRVVPPQSYYQNINSPSNALSVFDMISIVVNSVTPDIVYRGYHVLVVGQISNSNGGVGDVPLTITLNGTQVSGTIQTGPDGTFHVEITVPHSLAGGQYEVRVAIMSSFYTLGSPTTWKTVDLFLRTQLMGESGDSISVMPQETFTVSILLSDEDGVYRPGQIIVLLNATAIASIMFAGNGVQYFQIAIPNDWPRSGQCILTFEYGGGEYLGPSNLTFSTTVHVFRNIVLSSLSDRIVAGAPLAISGRLTDDVGLPIATRVVSVEIEGIDRTFVATTDQDGRFSTTLADRAEIGIYSFNVSLRTQLGDILIGSYIVRVEAGGNTQSPFDIMMAVGAFGFGAGVVALIYFFKRIYPRRRRVTLSGVDTYGKLRNIKKLADAGKYAAAIILAYKTFEQMCGAKTGSERARHETPRAYMERVMKSVPIDQTMVSEFLEAYQEARFSKHEITLEKYENAMRIFTDLYPRIDIGTARG